jgi:hypothetical protein
MQAQKRYTYVPAAIEAGAPPKGPAGLSTVEKARVTFRGFIRTDSIPYRVRSTECGKGMHHGTLFLFPPLPGEDEACNFAMAAFTVLILPDENGMGNSKERVRRPSHPAFICHDSRSCLANAPSGLHLGFIYPVPRPVA